MEKSNLERLHSLLMQHERRLNEKRPDLVEEEAQNFLKRLFRNEQRRQTLQKRKTSTRRANRQSAPDRTSRLKAAVKANPALDAEISSLELLDDPALWNAAQTKMPAPDSKQMEELHRKQRLTGLSEAEAQELSRLEQQYERVILVRSHSAWLLEQRGHDIRPLISSPKSRKLARGEPLNLTPGR